MPTGYVYNVFGISLKSAVEIPDLESLTVQKPGEDPEVSFDKERFRCPPRSRGWSVTENFAYRTTQNHRFLFAVNSFCGDFRVDFARRKISWRTLRGGLPGLMDMLVPSRILGLVLPYLGPSLLLHAGIPVVRGKAVCFIGPSGRGKSTLTAAFLKAGHPVLSDELAVIKKEENGDLSVPRGLPDIRLWPKAIHGVCWRDLTAKRILFHQAKKKFPLANGNGSGRQPKSAAPLGAVYVLSREKCRQIEIRPLGKREALRLLFQNGYNRIHEPPQILKNQFEVAAEVIRRVPVKRVVYPSGFKHLPAVRQAILSDLR